MVRIGVLSALILGLAVPHASAGVYSTVEQSPWPTQDARAFRNQHVYLRQLTNPAAPLPERNRALLVSALASKSKANLTPAERLNAGAALIRLGNYEEAVKVLEPGARQEARNSMLLSTLATAQFLDGQQRGLMDLIRRAKDNLAGAMEGWNKDWKALPKDMRATLQALGWTPETPAQLYKVEEALLKLIRLRERESLKAKDKAALFPGEWDALFDDGQKPAQPVRFVGASGRFEVGSGKLSATEAAKLPPDAIATVQQLLLWMPNDDRLVWLLAELLNAQGNLEASAELFRDIAARQNFKEVPHAPVRKLPPIEDATAKDKKLFGDKTEAPALFRDHWSAIEEVVAERQRQAEEALNSVTPQNPPPTDGDAKPTRDWSLLANAWFVGFLVGAAVAFFAYWQVREARRRWQSRQTARVGGPHG